MDYDMSRVLMDHNVEDTTPVSLKAGAWAGHTIYPISKLSPERMANIIEANGYDRMMINSAEDWGPSDPLMVPYTIESTEEHTLEHQTLMRISTTVFCVE